MDLPRKELVRGGKRHHREVDEEEFARSREAVEFLVNPRGRRPGHFVLQANRGQSSQGFLDDLERLGDRRRVVHDDVQVNVGPFINPVERGRAGFPERMDGGKGLEFRGQGAND